MTLGHWPKLQKLHIYRYSHIYTPARELKLSLISLYGQQFPRYRPIFKITIWGHETWSLALGPEVAHNILSFYLRGSKLSYSCSAGSQVSEIQANFQKCYIWAWNLVTDKSSRSCTYTLSTPSGLAFKMASVIYTRPTGIKYHESMGSKLSLFSLYGPRFPRDGIIFKIATFGHETWPLANSSRSCTHTPFPPLGGKSSGFRDMGRFSKLLHLDNIMTTMAIISQSSRSYTYTLFLPQVVKLRLL